MQSYSDSNVSLFWKKVAISVYKVFYREYGVPGNYNSSYPWIYIKLLLLFWEFDKHRAYLTSDSYVIRDLKPLTLYVAYVDAMYGDGSEESSLEINFSTSGTTVPLY